MRSVLVSLALLSTLAVHAADKPRLAPLAELDQPVERLETAAVIVPEALKQSGRDDTVSMTLIVSTQGRVERIEQLTSTTPEGGAAASQAAKKWLFARAFSGGEPVSFALPVTIAIRPTQATDAAVDTGAAVGSFGGVVVAVAEPRFEWIPEYPAELQASPVDGYALVSVFVDEDGRAGDAVTELASRTEFSGPAAAIVPTWIFTPAMSGGKRVATRTTVKVDFAANSAAWTPAERDLQARLRYLRSYDEGPSEKSSAPVVFPYEALISDKGGGVMLNVVVGPDGRVARIVPEPGSDPDYVAAARASLAWWEFFPATRAEQPVFGHIRMQLSFDPRRDEFDHDDATLALIAGLRDGSIVVPGLKQVDTPPRPKKQENLRFPADHEGPISGEALIECIIDREGRPRLPRIIRTSTPEFGWAAATAVTRWRFEPATQGGEAVVCRARLPIRIAPANPDAPASPATP